MNKFQKQLEKVVTAQRSIQALSDKDIKKALNTLAKRIVEESESIIKENRKDLKKMRASDPMYDRLKLTFDRIESIAREIENVANLNSPINIILEKTKMPSGISIQRVSVPIGVIGIIYESRPNVTLDVFSICFKSGNAVVLKGGKEAANSNKKLVSILQNVLNDFGIDKNIVMLLDNARSQTKQILEAHGYIDLIIPRGSANLINFVRENSKVPVIETGAGIVHTYFDEFGDVEKGKDIIYNAKTRRPSVCNSLDTLIIHEKRLNDLPKLIIEMENKNVEIFADPKSFQAIKGFYSSKLLKRASKKHFGNEFLDYKMSIKTVRNIEEAIEHITEFSSKHSEAIITQDKKNAEKFLNTVDAAAVYLNTSTAFTDGAQFGLGAEIGISTQKLHARGPMGLEEMTSYKWIIESDGAVRE